MTDAGTATRSQLEEQRRFLLTSLRDLDAERHAGDIAEADYLRLRDDYTARAAAVLRALAPPTASPPGPEAGAPAGAPAEAPAPAPAPAELLGPEAVRIPHRFRTQNAGGAGWRRLVTALALAAAAGLAGYAMAGAAGERSATDEATGSLPEGSVDRITKAQVLVSEGKILEAIRVYDSLLDDDPENPVALAQRGWLLSRVDPSLVDAGLTSIDKAIALDPGYADARFFRGMILWKSKGQAAAGAEELQRAIDARPPPQLVAVLQQARDQALAAAAADPRPAP